MAGAGYKLFQTGDVLTATEVNTYLQQQVTMVFANSTARTTALSGVLAEGMMSYLQDTNLVEVYDGSSWVSVGNTGDITGVTAGAGLTGGGTSGTVTLTNDMATTITAKGDLLVGTGSATYDNLAVGTDGYTLVADSSVSPQGLKWAVDPVADVITTAGDLIYGTAADTVARLGIGTAGQVLKVNSGATAPEWGAATSGMTFISRTTWSSASSHTVDNVFTSTYTSYLIIIEDWIQSAYTNIPQIQMRYGSTTETSGYYGSSFGTNFSSSSLQYEGTNNAAAFDFYRFGGESPGWGTFIVANVERVGTGSTKDAAITGHGNTNTDAEQFKFGMRTSIERDYTGFILKTSAGTSSGVVTVYGLAKA